MTDINQLVEQIKQSTDYQTNKRILREKITTDLHFAYNGGLFKATPELFSFVVCWNFEELFLEDTYQNPIKINRKEFIEVCGQHYQMVMNRWHIEHEELKRARKV
jgi:hypothetical protein